MRLRKSDTIVESINMKLKFLVLIIMAVAITGCATSEKRTSANFTSSLNSENITSTSNNLSESLEDNDFDLLEEELSEKIVEINDPLEPVNRIMYNVNDTLYFWVLKPCAETVEQVVPEPARIGIQNFFNNLTAPVRLVNCLLQGKGEAADTELRRFLVNTTVGVLGFGDPAQDEYGLRPVKEDLGQTLAVYGLEDGFYIVWPLLGPSTLRDSAGKAGDLFLNPVFYVEPTETAISISAVKVTNESSFHIGEYEIFKDAALDPYVAMREAYIQYRKKQIQE
jgi:phospholipid-binding lipoprotein MlaA